jgi:predicted nucleotide-binding protein (sugar kinase/HSP70/actin superfamily)
MPSACGPCRFGQYTVSERLILEREGIGELAILAPNNDNAYQGLEERLRRRIFAALTIGDVLFKLGCRYRPYEDVPGSVDELLTGGMDLVRSALETNGDLTAAVRAAVDSFARLPKPRDDKPLVGVVGEIFVRANPFSNDFVVRAIENAGGEAWLSPFHEWVLYAAWEHERRAREGWDILGKAKSYLKNRYLSQTEQKWYQEAGALLAERHEPTIQEMADAAAPYASFNFGGEVLVTVGRAIYFKEQGAAMVVNCSPFGCMPGGVVNALLNEVQRDYTIPMLNLMYDGTGDLNRRVAVFLRNLDTRARAGAATAGARGIRLPMVDSRKQGAMHA